jgi:hypothetical protein
MNRLHEQQAAAAGDVIVVEGERVGAARRIGEVLEVLGGPERAHYRVQWDDGHESLFYPHAGSATIKHAAPRRSSRAAVVPAEPADDEAVLTHEP